jgi:hypothetical protein
MPAMLTGESVQADAEQVLERAEAAGHLASPALHCAFFQAAAAAAQSRKQNHALDARERVLARLERLESLCRSTHVASNPAQPLTHPQQSLTALAQTVRAFVENGFAVEPLGSSAAARLVKARAQTRASSCSRVGARGAPCNALLAPAPGPNMAAGVGNKGTSGRRGGVLGGGGVAGAKSRKKGSSAGTARTRKTDS